MSTWVNYALYGVLGILVFFVACRMFYSRPVVYNDDWLDSPLTQDRALTNPNALLSQRVAQPTMAQQQAPVCVLVHGFTASSFEFDHFLDVANNEGSTVQFSTVVMGGHGRDYQAFKQASYQDWVAPILAEVQALKQLGYTNIAILGVSTGATASLHLLLNQPSVFEGVHLVMVDPYIVPKNKMLFWTHILGLVALNTRSGAQHDVEYKHWYTNRPASALNQLRLLVLKVQQQLGQGLSSAIIPNMHVFTSDNDPTADTQGVALIQQAFGNDNVRVRRYISSHHVIIEPQSKDDWSKEDEVLSQAVILEILGLLL
jgi:carboxylesterase